MTIINDLYLELGHAMGVAAKVHADTAESNRELIALSYGAKAEDLLKALHGSSDSRMRVLNEQAAAAAPHMISLFERVKTLNADERIELKTWTRLYQTIIRYMDRYTKAKTH